MKERNYPVIEERSLDPVRRVWWKGARRALNELPTRRAGTLLVFETGTRWEEMPYSGPLNGREEVVVDAVAVSLVDRRKRVIKVELTIPSADAADDFLLEVYFCCRVTDPVIVAQAGLLDVRELLAQHLKFDPKLARLGIQHTVEQLNLLRRDVDARIHAYCEVDPPKIEGLNIGLVTVAVATPQTLRFQAELIRNERWNQHLGELQKAFEDRDVERLSKIFHSGAEFITALGVSRGQISTEKAADDAYLAEQRKRLQVGEYIKILADGGHLDKFPMDVGDLIENFMHNVVGNRADVGGNSNYSSITGNDQKVLDDQRTARTERGPDIVSEDDLAD
ncbi:MAG: hypothetical protein ACRDTA_22810 [Pseudonocardiaceae bacterium]